MDQYKRLMVGLEMIPADESTIRYAEKLGRMAGAEKLYFVHVAPSLDLPEAITRDFPEVVEPVDESMEAKMRAQVEKHMTADIPGAGLEFDAVEGPLLRQLMKFAKQKLADLLVVGRELSKFQRDLRIDIVIRKAPCSVMLVPEGSLNDMGRILVAIDFSDCSAAALDAALAFARASGEQTVVDCLMVYDVPTGYHKTGKSFDEFAEIMKGNTEQRFDEFIAGIDTAGVDLETNYACNEHVSEAILGHAGTSGADLLLIGGRGITGPAAVLLGSNAEQVIRGATIPTLVVKEKGATLDIIDALLQI